MVSVTCEQNTYSGTPSPPKPPYRMIRGGFGSNGADLLTSPRLNALRPDATHTARVARELRNVGRAAGRVGAGRRRAIASYVLGDCKTDGTQGQNFVGPVVAGASRTRSCLV